MKSLTIFYCLAVFAIAPVRAQQYIGIDMYMPAQSAFDGFQAANNGQLVGSSGDPAAGIHAWLWTGPGGAGVDLHPTNLGDVFLSAINATSGAQQVGHR